MSNLDTLKVEDIETFGRHPNGSGHVRPLDVPLRVRNDPPFGILRWPGCGQMWPWTDVATFRLGRKGCSIRGTEYLSFQRTLRGFCHFEARSLRREIYRYEFPRVLRGNCHTILSLEIDRQSLFDSSHFYLSPD